MTYKNDGICADSTELLVMLQLVTMLQLRLAKGLLFHLLRSCRVDRLQYRAFVWKIQSQSFCFFQHRREYDLESDGHVSGIVFLDLPEIQPNELQPCVEVEFMTKFY